MSLLGPLRHRDFRLLWSGMCVSLLGDGVFLVAMAWQVYSLSDAPTALSLVGVAMAVPTLALLLLGGVVSDRVDRRRAMLGADLARGLAVGALAALSLSGELRLWHVVAIVGVYGAGTAFALDAASFAASAGSLLAMRPHRRPAGGHRPASVTADLGAGLAYVAGRRWLWVTLAAAALAFLAFMGPAEVLLPYLVKHSLHGSAAQLGLVLAAGGVGSAGCALLLARGGLPRNDITFMYVAWTLGTLAVAGYGLSTAVWQLMLASLAFNGLETAGTIVWATAKQRHVPAALLGRVSSLDWLISTGLLPLSYALAGPVSGAIGARATLIGAGLLGGVVTFAALYVPGVRAVEGVPARGIELAASG